MSNISEEEWIEVTNTLKEDTAPSISGIGYRLIKKVSSKVREYFVEFANKVICERKFLKKWKLGQIYLIPKSTDWEFNLASTRPIMLLETFRKLIVRIVQKKLSKVFVEKQILKSTNFAGLSSESTMAPIHVLNNVREDAIQKEKELWIAFQDMRKAFDSV